MRRGEVDEEFYMISRGSVELATGPDSFERPVGGNVEPPDFCGGVSDRSLSANSTLRGVPKVAGSGYDQPRPKRGSNPPTHRVASIIDDDDGSGDDSFLKILSKGQAFGEMALLVNCQRTADVPAITYVEMCVLNRSDFQRILTTHPEDRKKVLFAMLSTCMVANEAKGVNCPLIGMVRSVYSGDGGMRIGAEEAAALILDVINSDVEDTSIRYGVNARLRRQLIRKRDANSNITRTGTVSADSPAANSSANSSTPTFGLTASQRQQPATARVSNNPGAPACLEIRIQRIEDSLETLMAMMGEMRSAIDRVAPPTNVAQHTDATRSSTEDPHHHRRLSRSASSIAVADGIDASKLQQQSRQSESHDDAAQTTNPQRSFRKLWVTDRAVNDSTSANSPGQLSTGGVSPTSAQRHPPLKSRLSAVSSST
ncbi:Voltage-gated ion channel [Globisporangium polare]